jgi:DNA-binding NtrC family response regulator
MANILLLVDDEGLALSAQVSLEAAGHHIQFVSDAQDIQGLLAHDTPDVLVLYPRSKSFDFSESIRTYKQLSPETEIVLGVPASEEHAAILTLELGVFGYCLISEDKALGIPGLVQRAFEHKCDKFALLHHSNSATGTLGLHAILGRNPQIRETINVASKVAATDSAIMILGELGTGKRLLAESIHARSLRKDRPFLTVRCKSLSKETQEADLFGHTEGFAGSDGKGTSGIFANASGGTIFLDELSELTAGSQIRLLQYLEDHTLTRVGESTRAPIDVRVMCATSADPQLLINDRSLREDLYYRLSPIALFIPPLRQRKDDIPTIVTSFVNGFSAQLGMEPKPLTVTALDELIRYDWPGNVRELKTILERAVFLSTGSEIGSEYFPKDFTDPTVNITSVLSNSPTLDELERRYILETLVACKGNKVITCERLRISTTTLWRKLKQYGLELEAPR